MSDPALKLHGQQPPPPHQSILQHSDHPQPRRTSPGNSVTLKHHRLARDASLRASAGSAGAGLNTSHSSSPRRNSSGESYDTTKSDPRRWFDQSNENPGATFDNGTMDVDPPFFQKETDSSEEKSYRYSNLHVPPKFQAAQSSSAEDYRSVIDDLTVEIKKLKEELKRYKQQGPDMLRKDKLFEIKIHGLPKRKKRELETTLRDFAATLDESASSRRTLKGKGIRDPLYAGSGSVSKHASSSSGSNARPVDSAYASMSTGANSSGTSLLGKTNMSARMGSSNQKVESYLRDIPEGLFPRQTVMTDREKKKLVVRRLEHLFTGKLNGRTNRRSTQPVIIGGGTSAFSQTEGSSSAQGGSTRPMPSQPPNLPGTTSTSMGTSEPAREARILPHDRNARTDEKKSRSRDNASTSQSQGDQTESGGNGNSSRSGANASPTGPPPPEQRPTRLTDLDPDRAQVPAENMEYIRHLGLVPPELISERSHDGKVRPDADGWVYLNLLCSMAQLHILNVTPDFVRSAVSEISIKLQLSPDGRKVRWRGGADGTKFHSDVSGASSQRRPDTDETESSDDPRKRRKVGIEAENDDHSGRSSKNHSKFGPQISGSSESFHYKPLFVHRESSQEQTSLDDTLSSFGPIEDSNVGDSRWGFSGSGNSGRKKRRHDGAIIYYNGAPFCTDLAGDPGDVSPTANMTAGHVEQQHKDDDRFVRPRPRRTESGSSIMYRPLSDEYRTFLESTDKMDLSGDGDGQSLPELSSGTDEQSSSEFPWSGEQQFMQMQALEPCGLGGVLPDDHFMVVVTTKRPKECGFDVQSPDAGTYDEAADSFVSRLAAMSTTSPLPFRSRSESVSRPHAVEIEYVSGRIKSLAPASLPPPALFYPPFSPSSSADDSSMTSDDEDDDDSVSVKLLSRPANPHRSDGYPDGVDLSSGDEDGEDPDEEFELAERRRIKWDSNGSAQAVSGNSRGRSKSASADLLQRNGGSSAATAGGVESDFTSSDQQSP